MNEYIIIGGMAVITFLIRYTLFAAAGRAAFPPWFEELLRFVPPAVLSAIIVPSVLIPEGGKIVLSLSSPHLVGGCMALVVGWKSRNLLLTIVAGMAVFWLWRWLWPVLFS